MLFKVVFLFLFILIAPCHLYAQDAGNTIQVIQEDGAIQSLEIPTPTPQATQEKPAPISTENLLEKMEKAMGDETEISQPPETEIEKIEEISVQETVKQPIKPKKQRKETKPAKKKIKKSPVRSVKYTPSDKIPLPPQAKPQRLETPETQPIVIDRDEALRIALEYAPPSRSFTVFENRSYKEKIVYQVTFRTENGPHDILVDAETGEVLKR